MNKLYIKDASCLDLANLLVKFTWQIELTATVPSDNFYLQLDSKGLSIIHQGFKPFSIDELYLQLRLRQKQEQLLIAAIKLTPASNHTVFDLTAGLGRDANILAQHGYRVVMVEKHPIFATILHYAILKGYFPKDQVSLFYADSLKFLSQSTLDKPDVIYLDPMFEDKKAAKTKKAMQLIQLILNQDQPDSSDNIDLFNLSLKIATKKVIVKRDDNAKALVSRPAVSYVKMGKLIRYDVYVLK